MAILFLPLIGTILYFVFRPMELASRYTYGAGLDPTTDALTYGPRLDPTTDRLSTLADLHDRGVITDEQCNSGRAAILTQRPRAQPGLRLVAVGRGPGARRVAKISARVFSNM